MPTAADDTSQERVRGHAHPLRADYPWEWSQAALSAIKRRLVHGRILGTGLLLNGVARALTWMRPRGRWYWDALFFSRLMAWVMRRVRPGLNDPSLEARLLHRFLDVLAEGGRRFPIPVRVEGMEILEELAAGTSGFVCCTAHVPFVKLFIPVVRQAVQQGAELVIVVKYPNADGCVEVWCDDPVKAIAVGSGVLLQTRSLLRRGGCLMLLADKEQGEYISSNIFRFVGKIQSRILMGFPHLQADGVILLQIVEAPAPECRNELEIRANLDFIAQNVRSILAGDEAPEKVRPGVIPMAQLNVAERGREIDRIQLYSRSQLEARTRRLEQLLGDRLTPVADRDLYEKRLQLMQEELDLRSRVQTRSEYAQDGTPLF
ncbi:MAG TPA: hypothetical protein VGD62_08525 [Acidobacteriaceae bacterium]